MLVFIYTRTQSKLFLVVANSIQNHNTAHSSPVYGKWVALWSMEYALNVGLIDGDDVDIDDDIDVVVVVVVDATNHQHQHHICVGWLGIVWKCVYACACTPPIQKDIVHPLSSHMKMYHFQGRTSPRLFQRSGGVCHFMHSTTYHTHTPHNAHIHTYLPWTEQTKKKKNFFFYLFVKCLQANDFDINMRRMMMMGAAAKHHRIHLTRNINALRIEIDAFSIQTK